MGLAASSGKTIHATETVTNQENDTQDTLSTTKKRANCKLLSAKGFMAIATWNVRTLLDNGKLETAIQEMKRYDLDILGLCETRWLNQGKITFEGTTMIYSGGKTKHMYGVGILLNAKANQSLLAWEPISERIITARFHGIHSKMSIIQIYAPTNTSDDTVKQEFYEQLQTTIDNRPKHDLIVLMGDFKAQISKDRNGYEIAQGPFGSSNQLNDNGERLLKFCLHNQLKMMNTYFKHKNIHKKTWTSPDGNTHNEIDYICISKRWSSSVQDVKVKRGADIGSDHELVVGKIKLKLKTIKKKRMTQPLDIEQLKDKEVQQRYAIAIENKLKGLNNNDETDHTIQEKECYHAPQISAKESAIEDQWNNFKNAVTTVVENVIGRRRGRNTERWISNKSWDLIDERKRMKQKMVQSQNENIREEYKRLDKLVKKQTRKDKQDWLEKKTKEAQEAADRNDSRTVYRIIKELTNGGRKQQIPIKSKEGKTLNSEKEIEDRWIEHFQSVLNQPAPTQHLNVVNKEVPLDEMEMGPITIQETYIAINKLKNNKAPGTDGIHPEMLKHGGEYLIKMLQTLCNTVWNNEKVPDEWKTGTIIPLPKKGDLGECSNWRGITLLSIPSKVLCIILLNRMKSAIDKILRDEQSGFRPGRSCTDAIFALRNIIEKTTEQNIPIYVHFVDFQKAFDSIHRETMWKILLAYGIPEKFVRVIKAIYEGTKCNVRLEQNTTQTFEINTGVRQGCILSPFLFTIVIDYLLSRQEGKGYGIPLNEESIFDLDFADDIAMLETSNERLQMCTDELSNNARKIGLRFNAKKCETMCTLGNQTKIKIDEDIVKTTNTFTYLGSKINNNGNANEEIRTRIGKANAAFGKMINIMTSKQIHLKTKLNIYHATVTSILLYGSETWQMYATESKKLNAFHHGCLRKILGITYLDRIRNEEVMRRTNEREMTEIIRERRLRWFGHLARMGEEKLPRRVFGWKPDGKRKRGRPRLSWRETVCRDLKEMGLSWKEAEETAHDRRTWRFVTAQCAPGTGRTKV